MPPSKTALANKIPGFQPLFASTLIAGAEALWLGLLGQLRYNTTLMAVSGQPGCSNSDASTGKHSPSILRPSSPRNPMFNPVQACSCTPHAFPGRYRRTGLSGLPKILGDQ
ncbi:hypothetical protein CONLIGDRAFT_357002 [Coniochaeta ligniaria NRRL 30616]|uniref:Uncharacterized protein n=1 Tax=Coniochaeta ligniaria NRRL 30616 TaxID=1408157 RepID=A0A1J7JLC4_9PEZI|nr:hypothetical protein CONLIGDRAFT_357002 [Coniochaeta ligniaria NRRL 30616]